MFDIMHHFSYFHGSAPRGPKFQQFLCKAIFVTCCVISMLVTVVSS